jgi:CRISPR type I-E-associated protein CasB/Cse2
MADTDVTSTPAPETDSQTNSATAPSKIFPALQDARNFADQLAALSPGQRAQLKRNVGQGLPGRGVAWFYNLLYQGDDVGRRLNNAEIYFLVATLYSFNRVTTARDDQHWGTTLGRSMQLAARESGSESVKRRFQILLDADFEGGPTSELAFRLRQTLQWLKGQNVGFDPARLIYDLQGWTHVDRFVQKQWARDFFAAPTEVRETTRPVDND